MKISNDVRLTLLVLRALLTVLFPFRRVCHDLLHKLDPSVLPILLLSLVLLIIMHQVLLGALVELVDANKSVADAADFMLNGEPLIISLALFLLFLVNLNFDGTVVESPVLHHLHVLHGWVEKGGPKGATVQERLVRGVAVR